MAQQRAFAFYDTPPGDAADVRGDAGPLTLVRSGQRQVALFHVPVAAVARRLAKPRSLFNGQKLNAIERLFQAQAEAIHAEHQRPRQYDPDCMPGGCNEQRPCPWVGCENHLAIDVTEEGGLKLNFPDVMVVNGREYVTDNYVDFDSMKHTCAKDLTNPEEGMTHAQLGEAFNCVESNIERIEAEFTAKLRSAKYDLGEE